MMMMSFLTGAGAGLPGEQCMLLMMMMIMIDRLVGIIIIIDHQHHRSSSTSSIIIIIDHCLIVRIDGWIEGGLTCRDLRFRYDVM